MKILKYFLITCFALPVSVCGDTITLNWLNEDGTISTTTTCESGGDIILPQTPTKYGYTFVGWQPSYTEITYLQSSGTQYIDTGYQPNNNTRVVVKYAPNTSTWGVFGARNTTSGPSFDVMYRSQDKSLRYDYNKASLLSTIRLTTDVFTIDADKNNFTVYDVDGNNIYQATIDNTNESDFAASYNMFFPGLNTSGGLTNATGGMTIYYFKIYDNDVLVRDFIPVLDHSDVPCMYDKITGDYFYNAGTGNFIAGPVIIE